MVSEDLDDFSVDVIEFDDGTRVEVDSEASNLAEPVLPSDRFTDDYDRSYPPKPHHHNEHHHNTGTGHKPYRRSEDHGYNTRYNYDNRRQSNEGERRYSSSDRWSGSREGGYSQRRPSYDRKPDQTFHPTTLLQRPRRLSEQSFRSDHSQEHTNALEIIPEPATEEITVVQKNLMLTAAERAKKRLDEQEVKYKATAERARQKALALAEQQRVKEGGQSTTEVKPANVEVEKKILTKQKSRNENNCSVDNHVSAATKTDSPKTKVGSVPKVPDTSKPWNLVAAKITTTEEKSVSPKQQPSETESVQEVSVTREETTTTSPALTEPSTFKVPKIIAKDQQSWDNYVTKVRNDKPLASETVTSLDWNSYATRLQQSEEERTTTAKQKFKTTEDNIPPEALKKQQEPQVEVLDYSQNEEWGTIPAHIMNGRAPDRGGWIRNKDEYRNRSGSRSGRGGRTKAGNRLNGLTKNTDHWRSEEEEHQPVVVEILKHEPKKTTAPECQSKEVQFEEETVILPKKTRLANLLKESTSSIFPEYIEKLAGMKPANMSFMVDVDESDRDITMMGVIVEKEEPKGEQEVAVKEAEYEQQPDVEAYKENNAPSAILDEITSTTSSRASTPPSTQLQQSRLAHQDKLERSPRTRMDGNPNFPVLIYQFPTNQQQQQQTEERRPLSNGYHGGPNGKNSIYQ